jgi:PleD family two-component response regulator
MAPLDNVRILVLERSAPRGGRARRLLEDSGACVTLAATTSDACAAALALQPELIVSGADFPSSEWHHILRLLSDTAPALLVWKAGSAPEEIAELALRLYAGTRR